MTSTSEPPVPHGPEEIAIVRQIYAALESRDLSRLLELLDPEIVVTQDPALPWGGRYEGLERFAEFGVTLASTIDSQVTIESIFAAGDEVIQCGRTRGTVITTGAPFDIPEVHRWSVREGKAVRAHFAIDSAAMLEALSSPGGGSASS
jgi:uncharacterized protein